MTIYIVEMWRYGCDYLENKRETYFSVAGAFEAAKIRLDNGEEWAVGVISEYNVDSGKCLGFRIFEQEGADIIETTSEQIWLYYH